jgi:heptosyltransferase-3
MNPNSRIIISRADSIGDVMLTLPMCGWIKKHLPQSTVLFLGRTYTRAIAEACEHIDEFIDWDEIDGESPGEQLDVIRSYAADCIIHVFPRKEISWLAKHAGIGMRIASGHRLHALTKSNKLVFFTRKNSNLHESQLNFKLLKPLGIPDFIELSEVPAYYGFHAGNEAQEEIQSALSVVNGRRVVILHPLSKGSAVEWPIDRFRALTTLLSPDAYAIFISGTAEEGERIKAQGGIHGEHVHDVTGKFDLTGLISFINHCDMLVAASTGPLHIAAALGKNVIGLYSPKRPIHPGRWSPVGVNAHFICAPEHPKEGASLSISADEVLQVIQRVLK